MRKARSAAEPVSYTHLDVYKRQALDGSFVDGLSAFSYRSASAVLGDEPQANGNFSPASLYLALAMTQMGAAGETRDEIAAARCV